MKLTADILARFAQARELDQRVKVLAAERGERVTAEMYREVVNMNELNADFNLNLARMSRENDLSAAYDVAIMARLRDIPDPAKEPFDPRLIDVDPDAAPVDVE